MSDDLKEELETALKHYAIHLKPWVCDFGILFLAWQTRTFLQEHINDLTESQKEQLNEIDQGILELISASYDEVGEEDASSLKLLADVINNIKRPPKYYLEFERNFSKYRDQIKQLK